MPTYKIAHLTGQGLNVIIFPVNNSFGLRTQQEQDTMIKLFQTKAKAAGLSGNVVPIWDGEGGKISYKAPLNQKAFFDNITHEIINSNLNKSISW